MQKTEVSPALHTDSRFVSNGTEFAVAFFPDFQTSVGPADLVAGKILQPAKPGDTIIFFAADCGPSDPPAPSGQVPATSLPLALPFEFTIGGRLLKPPGALVAPFLGLCQFNVDRTERQRGSARRPVSRWYFHRSNASHLGGQQLVVGGLRACWDTAAAAVGASLAAPVLTSRRRLSCLVDHCATSAGCELPLRTRRVKWAFSEH